MALLLFLKENVLKLSSSRLYGKLKLQNCTAAPNKTQGRIEAAGEQRGKETTFFNKESKAAADFGQPTCGQSRGGCQDGCSLLPAMQPVCHRVNSGTGAPAAGLLAVLCRAGSLPAAAFLTSA